MLTLNIDTPVLEKTSKAENVECSACLGGGEIEIYYGPDWPPPAYERCERCNGTGFVSREMDEQQRREGRWWLIGLIVYCCPAFIILLRF